MGLRRRFPGTDWRYGSRTRSRREPAGGAIGEAFGFTGLDRCTIFFSRRLARLCSITPQDFSKGLRHVE